MFNSLLTHHFYEGKNMKKLLAIALVSVGVLVSACSVKYTEYRTPPKPEVTDMVTLTRKAHFVELMEVVRDNWHQAPSPELKEKVNRLMFEAGLTQECANRRCWLSYRSLRITTDEDFITIEFRDKSVTKIDVNEPDRAAKVIYG